MHLYEWAGVLLSCTSLCLCCMFLETRVAPHLLSCMVAHGCGFLLHRWKQDYKACQAEGSSRGSHSAYAHVMHYFVCMYAMCVCVTQVETREHNMLSGEQLEKGHP